MKPIRYISLYIIIEFLLSWILSIVFMIAFEPKAEGIKEILFAGAGIQFIQISLRLLSLSFAIIWLVHIKLNINSHFRKAIITSVLMVLHTSLLTVLASILSQAGDIIFGSVSIWMPILLGISITPFILYYLDKEKPDST